MCTLLTVFLHNVAADTLYGTVYAIMYREREIPGGQLTLSPLSCTSLYLIEFGDEMVHDIIYKLLVAKIT